MDSDSLNPNPNSHASESLFSKKSSSGHNSDDDGENDEIDESVFVSDPDVVEEDDGVVDKIGDVKGGVVEGRLSGSSSEGGVGDIEGVSEVINGSLHPNVDQPEEEPRVRGLVTNDYASKTEVVEDIDESLALKEDSEVEVEAYTISSNNENSRERGVSEVINGSLDTNLDQSEEALVKGLFICDQASKKEVVVDVNEAEESSLMSKDEIEAEAEANTSPSNNQNIGERGSSEVRNGSLDTNLDQDEPQITRLVHSHLMPVTDAIEVANDATESSFVSRVNSELEFDAHSSPSSSGYVGERGSSGASSTSEIEEVLESDGDDRVVPQESTVDEFSSSVPWAAGKRHIDEDDGSISWRKRKKHFFVLSHSGKPIYSRYGDEHKLAGFSATLQAIVSFVENGEDHVQFVRAGNHQVVFLVRGPIYLVCISCTEESHEALRGQLELLYGQMLLILTKSINRCFEKNPKFDMTPLLGGTDAVFSSLIHSFSWNLSTFLHAYTCLPLAYPTRQAAGAILQDVADSGVLFAILMCKHKVVSLVGAQKASLHPDDMLLLSNFVLSSESFRTSESFSPICLPRYNAMAFLYAYVHYLDADTYLMLLTTSSGAFYHLKDCRIHIEMVLLKSNVLIEVQRSILEGGLHVEDLPLDSSPQVVSLSPHLSHENLTTESSGRTRESNFGIGGPAGLWHFIYRSINLDQYVASEFSSPINSSSQQKRLYRAYQKLYTSMHDKGAKPHKTQFRRDENYALLCWITQDFELYAAFDPLADKALAIKTCNRVCQWVRDVENEIFLLGSSPFLW